MFPILKGLVTLLLFAVVLAEQPGTFQEATHQRAGCLVVVV